jgi:hypothetical protein
MRKKFQANPTGLILYMGRLKKFNYFGETPFHMCFFEKKDIDIEVSLAYIPKRLCSVPMNEVAGKKSSDKIKF